MNVETVSTKQWRALAALTINNLPNPYETVRNWGTLPDGRRWGSVSAIHVDADGKHIKSSMFCEGAQGERVPCFTGNTVTAPRVYLGRQVPFEALGFKGLRGIEGW